MKEIIYGMCDIISQIQTSHHFVQLVNKKQEVKHMNPPHIIYGQYYTWHALVQISIFSPNKLGKVSELV